MLFEVILIQDHALKRWGQPCHVKSTLAQRTSKTVETTSILLQVHKWDYYDPNTFFFPQAYSTDLLL